MKGALIDTIFIPIIVIVFIFLSWIGYYIYTNFIQAFNQLPGAYETTKNIQERSLLAHQILYSSLPLLYFGLLIGSFISAYYSYTQPWMFIISIIFGIVAILLGWFLKGMSLEFFKSLPEFKDYVENNQFARAFVEYLPIFIAISIFIMNILLFFKF